MIGNKKEYIKMDNVESVHWWYKSLHCLTLKAIQKRFNRLNISILDAGCGTGGMLEYLRRHRDCILEGFDISVEAINIAKLKKLDVRLGNLTKYKYKQNKYDVIISNDTMYFFNNKEQKNILDEFYKSLNTNGLVILNLPSFDSFKGIHDKAVGIQKRFTYPMVVSMVDTSKYEIIEKKYWPFLLSPVVFFVRSVQRVVLTVNKNIKIKSDISIPTSFVNKILFYLVRFENNLFTKKPFGSSLFLVLRKITDN